MVLGHTEVSGVSVQVSGKNRAKPKIRPRSVNLKPDT